MRTIRHIRQRNGLDCGIAAAAMVVGVSYATAQRADPDPDADRGLRLRELSTVLARLTGAVPIIRRPATRASAYPRLCEFALPAETACIVLIRQPGRAWGHFIVHHGGRIYDPELPAPRPLKRYGRRTWSVVRVILPARAA